MAAENRKQNRVVWYDALNVLAAFCVVWIHFGNNVHQYDGTASWYFSLIPQVLCFWAVPVFFMLSGATLMEYRKRYSTKVFFRKRLLKVGLPFLFWGTLMVLYNIFTGEFSFDASHPAVSFLSLLLNRISETIYWFLPVILAVYLSMPVLTLLAKPENSKVLNYTVAAGVLTVSVLPFLANTISELTAFNGSCWSNELSLPVLGGYLLYPVLGYWASRFDFKKRERIGIYVLAGLSILLRYCGIRFLSERDGCLNQLFMDYLSFPAMILALAVFVFARYLLQDIPCDGKLAEILAKLSSCSFGVYLVHMFFIAILAISPLVDKGSAAWYFIWPPVVYAVTCCAVSVTRKIPIVRYLLP